MGNLRVHAIEGGMLADSRGLEKLSRVAKLSEEKSMVFVISPLHSGPLCLSDLLESAKAKDEKLWALLEKNQLAWVALMDSVVSDKGERIENLIRSSFEDIEDLLRSVWLLGDISSAVSSYFRFLTSYFISLIASRVLTSEGIPANLLSTEKALLKKSFPLGATIVYGNLAQSEGARVEAEGESEYTAALIASNAIGALTFWNHRSLLCTARHKDIPSAKVIEHMSYAEAIELSFFGAPIVHPHALSPAQSGGLDVCLCYWGEIEEPGTLISDKKIDGDSRYPVKAFSVMRKIALVNIEGAMSGVIGISSRLFTALGRQGISVILISQASSEYSICFAVPAEEAGRAAQCARAEFREELESHRIESISFRTNLAILAAVGEGMSGRLGVSGKFFSALARAGVSVIAIAQGSSERNISAVIADKDSLRALGAVHSAFFLSAQTLSIGVFGPGNIGGTFLDQLASEKERLKNQFGLDIRVRGIANSSRMLLNEEGIDLDSWRDALRVASLPLDTEEFLSHVGSEYYPHAALIDCTTSQELSMQYATWLERFHVITPNKKAATNSYEYYKKLFAVSQRSGKRFLYETTVGAGLPVINTLNDLIQTGDEIKKIEGIVSGTLAWLFSNYDGTKPFSSLVYQAKEMGYTEPDPRDDLSGMDVARKTVILAREMGCDVELADLQIQSLVPTSLKNASREEFLVRLPEIDEDMKNCYEKAKKEGKVLRYVGKVDGGKCSVALESYPPEHPFAQASGTDNVIVFTTSRYSEGQPLVIKGPGAGPAVTAGGVFSDLLRLAVYLGAKIL